MPKNYFETFATEGAQILKRKKRNGEYTNSFDQDFRSFFGCSPVVCGVIWVKCRGFSQTVRPKTPSVGSSLSQVLWYRERTCSTCC